MPTVSVIIPARNERFLPQTVDDLCAKARGDLEVIAILDGYWPDRMSDDARVHYVHYSKSRGMRAGLNVGVELARGKFVMKLDAHCMVSEGFDVVLAETCGEDWVCVPTRKRLDAERWAVKQDGRPDVNYQYIDLSNDGLNGKEWREKNLDRSLDAVRVDDIISCQGSCYFMRKAHWQRLGLLDEEHYGTFRKDPQEVLWKTWTSGGRCVRVKDAWYAHLHKGRQYGRMYKLDMTDYRVGDEFVKAWWTDSAWDERQLIPLREVFRRFPDMPGWADHPWMQERAEPTISVCIPVMNRRDDLEAVMPALLEAAAAYPPVEIAVLDYNSSDGLGDYVAGVQASLDGRGAIAYHRYEGRDSYHMAHARNLSVMASSGDYVLISSADIALDRDYFRAVREAIAGGATWTHHGESFLGVVCVRRDEFVAAGGFDERLEFYGKEDKDLYHRLQRRGARAVQVPRLLSVIRTPWSKKIANYREPLTRAEMHALTMAVFAENCERGVLVANEGREWGRGQWD